MNTQSVFRTLSVAARTTIVVFAILGLAAVLYAASVQTAVQPARLLALLVAGMATARVKVHLFKGSTVSLLTSVVLLGILEGELCSAILVALTGVVLQTIVPSRKLVIHQLVFNAGMIALTVTATWFTFSSLVHMNPSEPLSAEVVATIAASFVYFLGNSLSVSLIIGLTKGISMVHVWIHHFLNAAPSFLLAGFVSMGTLAMFNNGLGLIVLVLMVVSLAYYVSVRALAGTEAVRAAS